MPQIGAETIGSGFKTAFLAVTLFLYLAGGGRMGVSAVPAANLHSHNISFQTINHKNCLEDHALWRYLRAGLNYVEASGRDLPTSFVHPGGVAYGSLALTRIAIKDVILHCKEMSAYDIEDILTDRALYEECARRYADLLLRHYLKITGNTISREKLFDILQKAWFLGPTIFKDGGGIPTSRARNAGKYIAMAKNY